MLRNYFKIAWRLIRRNKLYSAINVFGLAVGMAACLLLSVFILHELRFDDFHENGERIYRVIAEVHEGGIDEISQPTPAGLGPDMDAEYDEVEGATRFNSQMVLVRYGNDELTKLPQVCFVDESFLDMFSFRIVAGDASRPLEDPHSIVLSETTAKSFFGDENPIGQTIQLDNRLNMTVSAIVEDCPTNSHLGYRALVSFTALKEYYESDDVLDNYTNWNYSTYVMLTPGVAPSRIEEKLPAFVDKYIQEGLEETLIFRLQPLKDIHLATHLKFDWAVTVSSSYLTGLAALALFILTIACINFMNLSTARAMRRAREVGLRKVMGADRKKLIGQFLGESILLAVIAIPVAIALVEFFMPTFSSLVGRRLDLLSSPTLPVLFFIPLLVLLVGIGGGIYPAFFLSVYQPVSILRGDHATGRQGTRLRRALIVFQFVLSIILMIATLVVHRQINFLVNRDQGFDREQIVTLTLNESIRQSYDSFRNDLLQLPGVVSVARSGSLPCEVQTRQSYVAVVNDVPDTLPVYSLIVDYDYIDVIGLTLLEGRKFDPTQPTDESSAYIINETAARQLGWAESAVGQSLHVWSEGEGRVIGVVKDFNYGSARNAIEPLALRMEPSWLFTIAVHLAPEGANEAMASIEEVWKKHSPNFPFEFHFMDEAIEWQYWSELRMGKIFVYATVLAIIVACLGLYGMAHYATEVRIREVGVRKVLGASVRSVTWLFIREFTQYVILANLIAWPVAYFVMSRWLDDFAYRISVGIDTLLLSTFAVLAVAIATVAFRAYRAASTNPARALRYE